jgi:hypothetical protein
VDLALVLSALMMGLAGSPHCVVMCGGISAALIGRCGGNSPASARLSFHLGRLLGYTAAGALVASSVSVLAALGRWSPALRPLWVLAHLAALALGMWLLWKGRQPAWLDQLGREGHRQAAPAGTWQRMSGPLRAGAVGAVWFTWPCGLLQSALMVAALANGPVAGAAVMATFAAASSLALGLAPAIWLRLAGGRQTLNARVSVLITRLSGAALAGAAVWALGHDVWLRVAAYCFS